MLRTSTSKIIIKKGRKQDWSKHTKTRCCTLENTTELSQNTLLPLPCCRYARDEGESPDAPRLLFSAPISPFSQTNAWRGWGISAVEKAPKPWLDKGEKKVTDLQGGISARLDIAGNCILSPSSCVTQGFSTIKCELKGVAVFHNHRR